MRRPHGRNSLATKACPLLSRREIEQSAVGRAFHPDRRVPRLAHYQLLPKSAPVISAYAGLAEPRSTEISGDPSLGATKTPTSTRCSRSAAAIASNEYLKSRASLRLAVHPPLAPKNQPLLLSCNNTLICFGVTLLLRKSFAKRPGLRPIMLRRQSFLTCLRVKSVPLILKSCAMARN